MTIFYLLEFAVVSRVNFGHVFHVVPSGVSRLVLGGGSHSGIWLHLGGQE